MAFFSSSSTLVNHKAAVEVVDEEEEHRQEITFAQDHRPFVLSVQKVTILTPNSFQTRVGVAVTPGPGCPFFTSKVTFRGGAMIKVVLTLDGNGSKCQSA